MFTDEDLIIFTDKELDKILAAFGHLELEYFQIVLSLLKKMLPGERSRIIDTFYKLVTYPAPLRFLLQTDGDNDPLEELISLVDGYKFIVTYSRWFYRRVTYIK